MEMFSRYFSVNRLSIIYCKLTVSQLGSLVVFVVADEHESGSQSFPTLLYPLVKNEIVEALAGGLAEEPHRQHQH